MLYKTNLTKTELKIINDYKKQFGFEISYPYHWTIEPLTFTKLKYRSECKLLHIFLWSRQLLSLRNKFFDKETGQPYCLCEYEELCYLLDTEDLDF